MAPAAALGAFTFVSLAGTPPPELHLEPLPAARSTYEVLRTAVVPFLASASASRMVDDLGEALPAIPPGLHLIYLMGHAWRTENGLTMAAIEAGENRLVSGRELAALLAKAGRPEETIVVLDSCHAACRLWTAAPCSP